jgi:predicted ATPase
VTRRLYSPKVYRRLVGQPPPGRRPFHVPGKGSARGAGRPVVFVGVEAQNKRSARAVRRVERDPGAEWDADAWWARIPAVRAVLDTGLDLPAGVTFLVGENGSGKSTLIEALAQAYGLNPEGGSRNAMHRTRHTESPLGEVLRLVRTPGRRGDAYFLRAETAHGLYTYLEGLAGSPDLDLHDRSHGEGFLALLERKFARPGFYLLDEPEAALSFTSTLSLMVRLAALAEAGAQIVVATHSPVLTALPAATVLELGEHGIRTTAWSQLALVDHFRTFLERPDQYLHHLLR